MTQRAYANYCKGYPTEIIIFSGKTEAGRDLEVVVPTKMAVKILTIAAQAYAICGHVGHAMWHAENDNADFENCSSCHIAK